MIMYNIARNVTRLKIRLTQSAFFISIGGATFVNIEVLVTDML
jgi:hypothetical protein